MLNFLAFDCWDHKCEKYKPFFDFTDDTRWNKDSMALTEKYYYLGESLIFLSISPIFYFAIVAVLEFKLIEKLLISKKKAYKFDHLTDEQVNLEKIAVAEKISELKGSKNIIILFLFIYFIIISDLVIFLWNSVYS